MNTDITALEYQIRQSVKFDGGCEVSFEYKKQSRFDNTMRLVFPFSKLVEIPLSTSTSPKLFLRFFTSIISLILIVLKLIRK